MHTKAKQRNEEREQYIQLLNVAGKSPELEDKTIQFQPHVNKIIIFILKIL